MSESWGTYTIDANSFIYGSTSGFGGTCEHGHYYLPGTYSNEKYNSNITYLPGTYSNEKYNSNITMKGTYTTQQFDALLDLLIKCVEKGLNIQLIKEVVDMVKKEGQISDQLLVELEGFLSAPEKNIDTILDGILADLQKN